MEQEVTEFNTDKSVIAQMDIENQTLLGYQENVIPLTTSNIDAKFNTDLSKFYNNEREDCLKCFDHWSETDQIDFVQHILNKMCHTQHGIINSFLKPMLQRDFLSLLPKFYLDHLAENILSYLDAKSLASCEAVCKQWNKVVCQGMLWKKLIERKVRIDSLWCGLSSRRGWKQYLYKAQNINNALALISNSMKQRDNTLVIDDPLFYEYFNANLCHLPPPSPSLYLKSSSMTPLPQAPVFHYPTANSSFYLSKNLGQDLNPNFAIAGTEDHHTAGPGVSSTKQPSLMMELNRETEEGEGEDNGLSLSTNKPNFSNFIPYFTAGSVASLNKSNCSSSSPDSTLTATSGPTNYALDIACVLASWFYKRLYVSILSDIANLESNWSEGKHVLRRIKCRSENSKGVYCLQYDDEKIVSGLRDNTIKIWDIKSLECIKVLTGHTGSVLCLQYDDKIIITGSSDATVRIWDVKTGELLNTLIHHCEAVLHLRFDDGLMVTCSKDRSIAVWDMRSPKDISLKRVLVGHRAAVNVVDFDNKYIVSASGDRTIKVWETSSCEFVRTLNGHKRGIACLQYRERLIVSGSSDYTIRLWDIECGSCLRILEGHEELVRCIRFDNKRIVSGAYDGKIKIWDLAAALDPRVPASSVCVKTLVEHTGRVFRLQFDEFQIVSSSHDDTILIWDFLNFDGKNSVDTAAEPLGGLTTMAVPLGPEDDELLLPPAPSVGVVMDGDSNPGIQTSVTANTTGGTITSTQYPLFRAANNGIIPQILNNNTNNSSPATSRNVHPPGVNDNQIIPVGSISLSPSQINVDDSPLHSYIRRLTSLGSTNSNVNHSLPGITRTPNSLISSDTPLNTTSNNSNAQLTTLTNQSHTNNQGS